MTKNYSSLHRGLVLKYFWQVMRQYKVSFFTVIFTMAVPFILDIFIPLQYLRLWNVISNKDFIDVNHAHLLLLQVLALHVAR